MTTTRRSDTLSPVTNPWVLRSAAARALEDARKAWREAASSPSDVTVRDAMRSCLVAGRLLRRAAGAVPGEAASMREAARRLDVAAAELRDELVKILETRRTVL